MNLDLRVSCNDKVQFVSLTLEDADLPLPADTHGLH